MKTIGIIGAMPSELADIRKTLAGAAVKNYSGFDFYISTFNETLVVNACCGIAKVNIFTDLCLAGEKAMKEGIKNGSGYLEIRNLKVNAIKKAVAEKIKLFGSAGKYKE